MKIVVISLALSLFVAFAAGPAAACPPGYTNCGSSICCPPIDGGDNGNS